MRLRLSAVLAGLAAALLSTSPAQAAVLAGTVAVADWQMNEPAGATEMTDGSGNLISGAIGDLVQTGIVLGSGNFAYKFAAHQGETPSRRIVLVDENDRLDPNSGYWSVELRFKTGKSDQNILQKGQATAKGGYWKIAMNSKGLTCHFRDGNRNNMQIRPNKVLNDNNWHVVLCERTTTGMAVTIDGTRYSRTTDLGPVNNASKLYIGGKYVCNWSTIGCDPFVGLIDYVTVRTGS